MSHLKIKCNLSNTCEIQELIIGTIIKLGHSNDPYMILKTNTLHLDIIEVFNLSTSKIECFGKSTQVLIAKTAELNVTF